MSDELIGILVIGGLLVFIILLIVFAVVFTRAAQKKQFKENKALHEPAVEVFFQPVPTNDLGQETGRIEMRKKGAVLAAVLLAILFVFLSFMAYVTDDVSTLILAGFIVLLAVISFGTRRRKMIIHENGIKVQKMFGAKTYLFSDIGHLFPVIDNSQDNAAVGAAVGGLIGALVVSAISSSKSKGGAVNLTSILVYQMDLRNGKKVRFSCANMVNAEYMGHYLRVGENPAISSYRPVYLIPEEAPKEVLNV